MPRALDGDGELALLLGREAGLADWLDATVGVDIALQGLDIAIIEIQIWIVLVSFHVIPSFA